MAKKWPSDLPQLAANEQHLSEVESVEGGGQESESSLDSREKEENDGALKWNDMMSRLQAYKNANGHTNVPYRWPKDPELGKWGK